MQNVPAAGGKDALMQLVNAKPDGYTLAMMDALQPAVAQVKGELGQKDIVRGITWLGRTEAGPILMGISGKGKFKTIQEMKGQTVRLAVTSMEIFPAQVLGVELGFTPIIVLCDGGAETAQTAARGDADGFVLSFTGGMRQIKALQTGLSPALVTTTERHSMAPDTPTAGELKLVETMALSEDRFVAAPPGMPDDLKQLLEATLWKVMNDPECRAR